jgi:hypothetical protein
MNSNQNPTGAPSEPNSASTPVEATAIAAPAKKSKTRRNVLIASGVVSLAGIGSTLAANISLNSGNNVEFGQGVAKTTACDADGFVVNPVTTYDNNLSIWRLDHVEVTGLNLTPVGYNHNAAGLSLGDAIAQHPGEYYDNNDGRWKRTCDGIVLDFKAYTDDINYWSSTQDGYWNGSHSTSSPVGWAQWNGNPNNDSVGNFGFAVIFDTNEDDNSFQSNYGVGDDNTWGNTSYTWWDNFNDDTFTNSSFTINSGYSWRPNSASISKIAVSSMAHFPSNYYLDNSGGIGTL